MEPAQTEPATPVSDIPLRSSRMDTLAPAKKMAAAHGIVIGVGAVGRALALQLASMGIGKLTLIDFDTVDPENLGPQMFRPNQLTYKKADVTAADAASLFPEIRVAAANRRFAKTDAGLLKDAHVFATVDNITTRGMIHEVAIKGGAAFLGDARVAGEAIRVIGAPGKLSASDNYSKTLFAQGEALVGTCSGAKMSTYGATMAAAALAGTYAQWLRGFEEGFTDRSIDLLGWDICENKA